MMRPIYYLFQQIVLTIEMNGVIPTQCSLFTHGFLFMEMRPKFSFGKESMIKRFLKIILLPLQVIIVTQSHSFLHFTILRYRS